MTSFLYRPLCSIPLDYGANTTLRASNCRQKQWKKLQQGSLQFKSVGIAEEKTELSFVKTEPTSAAFVCDSTAHVGRVWRRYRDIPGHSVAHVPNKYIILLATNQDPVCPSCCSSTPYPYPLRLLPPLLSPTAQRFVSRALPGTRAQSMRMVSELWETSRGATQGHHKGGHERSQRPLQCCLVDADDV